MFGKWIGFPKENEQDINNSSSCFFFRRTRRRTRTLLTVPASQPARRPQGPGPAEAPVGKEQTMTVDSAEGRGITRAPLKTYDAVPAPVRAPRAPSGHGPGRTATSHGPRARAHLEHVSALSIGTPAFTWQLFLAPWLVLLEALPQNAPLLPSVTTPQHVLARCLFCLMTSLLPWLPEG